MEEAKILYQTIVGNSKLSRSEKSVHLTAKIKEIFDNATRYKNKATIMADHNLMVYALRAFAIGSALIKIGKDGEYISQNFCKSENLYLILAI
jgi:hypothetical protein